jgi:hypothetical protein
MKKRWFLLIFVLILLTILIYYFISADTHKNIICANSKFNDAGRYMPQNTDLCYNDCSNYCSNINMKIKRAKIISNDYKEDEELACGGGGCTQVNVGDNEGISELFVNDNTNPPNEGYIGNCANCKCICK